MDRKVLRWWLRGRRLPAVLLVYLLFLLAFIALLTYLVPTVVNEAQALAQTRYANGVITNFELLDAQSTLRSAELGRLQARYDCVLARQAVARAAGVAPQP